MIRLFLIPTLCTFIVAELLSIDDAAGTVHLKISQGELLGKRIDSYENRTGFGFLGVPFGAPTDGPHRFARPIPADPWTGVRDVTTKGPACPAVGKLTYKRDEGGPMSEDCLHNYIYASRTCLEKGGCPVMFVLHGGGFNFESPVIFADDVIVHNFASDGQDVVVVIAAFRLENFGFLNLAPGRKHSSVPNVGVYDILLALHWTHREVHHFGGDPKRITLFGHSAGSIFADTLSISPAFSGLFSQMICMSGAISGAQAPIESDSLASWKTAELLRCAADDADRANITVVETVLACLRSKTWEEIVQANIELNNHIEDYHGPREDGEGGLFPKSFIELESSGYTVPTMIGTTSAEFHSTKFALDANGKARRDQVEELCAAIVYASGYNTPEALTQKCIQHYMKGKNMMDFEQDVCEFATTYGTVKRLSKRLNKVYLYSFTYTGIREAFKKYRKMDAEDHPGHSEDFLFDNLSMDKWNNFVLKLHENKGTVGKTNLICYMEVLEKEVMAMNKIKIIVYILGMHRGNFTKKDYEIEKIYAGMVRNFVVTGYPDPGKGQPVWKPFTHSGHDYYEIDFNDELRMPGMKKGYQQEAATMWHDDAQKYGGPVSTPSSFAPHYDRYNPMEIIAVYASHHTNVSHAHDKTLEAENEGYRVWTKYINNRRFQHLNGIANFRSLIVDPNTFLDDSTPTHYDVFMEILVVCVSALLIFILFRCCLHFIGVYNERKGYDSF